jgi:hypothetical protein
MAQAVEHLLSKGEVLSSNPSTAPNPYSVPHSYVWLLHVNKGNLLLVNKVKFQQKEIL